MKTWMISSILFVAVTAFANKANAQVGYEGSADEVKVNNAIPSSECQGLLASFKKRVISYNSDTQSQAEVDAQIYALMQDANSQARAMNCAQSISMTVETVDVSTSYRARIRNRMQKIVQSMTSAVNANSVENLRVTDPAAGIGIRG